MPPCKGSGNPSAWHKGFIAAPLPALGAFFCAPFPACLALRLAARNTNTFCGLLIWRNRTGILKEPSYRNCKPGKGRAAWGAIGHLRPHAPRRCVDGLWQGHALAAARLLYAETRVAEIDATLRRGAGLGGCAKEAGISFGGPPGIQPPQGPWGASAPVRRRKAPPRRREWAQSRP